MRGDWFDQARRFEDLDKAVMREIEAKEQAKLSPPFPPVLDACCGGRMMWFDKADPRCLYVDKRSETVSRTPGAQAKAYAPLEVRPDVQADFTDLPFPSDTFALVVMDPPHIEKMGATSYLAKEYGKLLPDWRDTLRKGFTECFRVLRPEGVLVFKWCEYEIPVGEVLALTDAKPLFGHKTGKKQLTHWIAFLKPNNPLSHRHDNPQEVMV